MSTEIEKNTGRKYKHVLRSFLLLYLSVALALTFSTYFNTFLIFLPCIAFAIYFFYKEQQVQNFRFTSMIRVSNNRINPILFFIIVASFTTVWWLAFYPGDFNLDAYSQWDQAHGIAPFSDWHPLTSTLLIKGVISIVDSMPFYIFVQIIFFSGSIAIMLNLLQENGISPKIVFLIAVFIGANPAIGLNTIAVTKDAQFTIIVVLLFSCFLSIYYSNKTWFKKTIHILILGSLSALVILVRHNGLLLVIPAYALMLFFYRKAIRPIMTAVSLTIIIVFVVKVPLARSIKLSPHENPIGEAVGIPMAMMANAYLYDSEHLPEEVEKFLLNIASREEWEEKYYTGEWDSCKWDFGGTDLFKNMTLDKILNLTLKTIICCPQAAYESFRINTSIVWNMFVTNPAWVPEIYVNDNDYGIENNQKAFFQAIAKVLIHFSLFPLISFFLWNTGFVIFFLLGVYYIMFWTFDHRKTFLFLPLIVFWLGTMCFLSGPNYRYFYTSAVLFLPLSCVILQESNRDKL